MSATLNPFDTILQSIESLRTDLASSSRIAPPEIIDRDELCKRLKITAPTAIRWERKNKIPCFRIGSAVRYNWVSVIKELEK